MPFRNFALVFQPTSRTSAPLASTRSTLSLGARLVLLFALPFRLFSEVPAVPDYKVGDKASSDVVTPVQLIVIDPERTEILRQKEAQRTPAIFRFYPNVIEDSEASLRSAFNTTREKFLTALEATYRRRKLTAQALTYPRFQRFVTSFQKQHKAFPLSTNLAQLWARGESDEPYQAELVTKLRDTLGQYIRTERLPAEARLGPGQVRVVALPRPETPLDLETVQKLSTGSMRSNIFILWRVREDLQNSFPAQDQATGKYLASFVKANCFFEEELTRQNRLKRMEPIWAADHYEPGQVIVKAGEVINARGKAALDQLKSKLAVDQMKAQVAEEKLKGQATVAQFKEQAALAQLQAQETSQRNRWLLAALLFFVLACCLIFWRLSARRSPSSLLPARVGAGESAETVISYPAFEEPIVVPLESGEVAPSIAATAQPWRQRALKAEARADKVMALVRARLMPHLARWMMNKVVRKVLWQRAQLLETQQKAEVEVAELEKRLTNLHAPLEQRLQAYEKRIAELEKDLAVKGAENRELIKAKIQVARKRLELERSKDHLALN